LTESRLPTEIIEMLNDYYALMFDAITSSGGSVNQIIGDGLMAIFGAPIQYEDHCVRAVKAALEILELLEGFNQNQAVQNKPQIKIGVGIASGQMIAGFTGTQHRATYTYTCVGDTYKIESHGLVQLKGKTIEVAVFSVSA
jgi:adenylate cyclase